MKATKKDECSYSFSNAIRTLVMSGVDRKDAGANFCVLEGFIDFDSKTIVS